jgi:predicted RNA-binding protein Jag
MKRKRLPKWRRRLNNFIIKLKRKKLSPITQKRIKSYFRIFFDGAYESDPVYHMHIDVHMFGITDFVTYDCGDKITVVITLTRPGILIGRGGETIESLKKFYNDMLLNEMKKPITIDIIESKLWP